MSRASGPDVRSFSDFWGFWGGFFLEVTTVHAYRHMVSGILVSSLFCLFYLWVRQKVTGRTVPTQHCRQAFREKKGIIESDFVLSCPCLVRFCAAHPPPNQPTNKLVYEETVPEKRAPRLPVLYVRSPFPQLAVKVSVAEELVAQPPGVRRLVVRSLNTERPIQLGHQVFHPLSRGDYEPNVGRWLGHPPYSQGRLCLAVVAEERWVADYAVYASFEAGCGRLRVSLLLLRSGCGGYGWVYVDVRRREGRVRSVTRWPAYQGV